MRKYTLNEDFFEKIDSEEKAYILGFIAADGYLDSEKCVRIDLSRVDREHLVKMSNLVGSNRAIEDYINKQGHLKSMVRWFSVKMIRDLRKHGICHNKSNSLCTWQGDEPLLTSWRAGLFDGDGSIHVVQGNGYRFKICGTPMVVNDFREWGSVVSGSRCKVYNVSDTFAEWIVNGTNMPLKLMMELYGSTKIALSRKASVVNDMLSILSVGGDARYGFSTGL